MPAVIPKDAAPRAGAGSLQNWVWDWLNLVQYEFHFTQQRPKGEQLNLSIFLISDSGFSILDDANHAEPQITDLAPVTKSETLLGLFVYTEWPAPDFLERYSGVRDFIQSKGQVPEAHRKAGAAAMCVDFSRVETEASASLLIDDLVAMANKSGYSIERK